MNQIITTSAITMSSREIAELAGKEHFHVMRDIRNLQEQLGELFVGSIQNWIHPQNGQTYEEFVLDKDTCLTLLLGYDAVARMKVVKRWQELEAQPDLATDEGKLLLIQDLAAKQLTVLAENKRLTAERDHAIATKAQIGSSREAQAMAKASSAVRLAERLKAEVGRSSKQATVKAVEHATNQRFPRNAFAALRRWCKANNVQAADVQDDLYGTVKAWPAGAWLDVYGIDLKVIFPHFTGKEVTHA